MARILCKQAKRFRLCILGGRRPAGKSKKMLVLAKRTEEVVEKKDRTPKTNRKRTNNQPETNWDRTENCALRRHAHGASLGFECRPLQAA
jgi:hypothetical protein